MRQAISIAVSLVVFSLPQGVSGAADDKAGTLNEARALVRGHDYARAVATLEDAIVEASPGDRAAMIELLRKCYQALMSEAEAAGKQQEAATYRDNLAILKPASEKRQPTDSSGARSSTPAVTAPPSATAGGAGGSTSAAPPSVTDRTPASPQPGPKRLPRAPGELDRVLSQEPSALPEPGALPPPAPDRTAKAAGPIAAPAPIVPEARLPQAATTPAGDSGATIPHDEAVQLASAPAAPATVAQAPSAEILRTQADSLFTRKKYEEAGQVYAGLAARNQLPAERKQVWAYCRWVAVVARINARPRTDREWDEIDQEIRSIQRLTPGNWYGEYLLNRVAEARRGGRPPGRSGKLVVRGSDPDETPPRGSTGLLGRLRSAPKSASGAKEPAEGEQTLGLPRGSSADDTSREGTPADGPRATPEQRPADESPSAPPAWQVRETRNFRIYHTDPALGVKAAEAAEATRNHQAKRWGSAAIRTAWSPRCDIYLYPSAAEFARMTGQPESSPGFSTMGINANRVISRRVNLRGDHPQLIAAILPHEVTHVVLADLFTEQQIPRWADEGIAVLAEPVSEQLSRAAELTGPLREGKVFKLSELMAIDYPNEEAWNLYYAQSVSVTQFMVQQGTPAQFISFVRGAQQKGIDTALREVYHMEGSSELEQRWQTFARRQAAEIAASNRNSASGIDPVRRQ
jgi:hypothetical protein